MVSAPKSRCWRGPLPCSSFIGEGRKERERRKGGLAGKKGVACMNATEENRKGSAKWRSHQKKKRGNEKEEMRARVHVWAGAVAGCVHASWGWRDKLEPSPAASYFLSHQAGSLRFHALHGIHTQPLCVCACVLCCVHKIGIDSIYTQQTDRQTHTHTYICINV